MSSQTFTKGALTGGTSGCLDAIDGDDVNNGDRAMVVTADAAYFYVMNSTSGASEDSPEIISPDTNAGTKRWILKGVCASADISSMNWIVDEDAMTSDSATKVPTQQSVKAYVDNLIVDEDNMASDSAALVPTQQSVKAYVDDSSSSITITHGYYTSTTSTTQNITVTSCALNANNSIEVHAQINDTHSDSTLIVTHAHVFGDYGGSTLSYLNTADSGQTAAGGSGTSLNLWTTNSGMSLTWSPSTNKLTLTEVSGTATAGEIDIIWRVIETV